MLCSGQMNSILVTTIAGSGKTGSSGRVGTAAKFSGCQGIRYSEATDSLVIHLFAFGSALVPRNDTPKVRAHATAPFVVVRNRRSTDTTTHFDDFRLRDWKQYDTFCAGAVWYFTAAN